MEEYNPWWFGEGDPRYEEWSSFSVKWVPEIIYDFEVKPFSLNFIIGPRQIGKTTAIVLFIHKVLLRRFKPEAIFYYSCDELSDYRELGEVIDDYIDFRESRGISSSVIFLDEITFVEDWWRAIKSRIDSKVFSNDVLFISGSASVELVAGKERFPGRRGEGKDYYILPMSFSEYAKVILGVPVKTSPINLDNIDAIIQSNKVFKKNLIDGFEKYLATGGFPLAIREFYERGRIINAYRTYIDWLKSDIAKSKRSEKLVKEIISLIIRTRLSPVSWNSVSKEVSASSPNTVREYIEFLEDLFIVKVLSFIDTNGKVMHRKRKKIHITDPFLYSALARYVREKVYEEQVVESTVISHLARLFNVHYWQNKKEIDAVVVKDSKLYGFEVKWSFHRYSGRYPIKTKILNREDIPLFLASIKWRN